MLIQCKWKMKKGFFTKISAWTAGKNGSTGPSIPKPRSTQRQIIAAKSGYRHDLGKHFKSAMEANLYRYYTGICKGIKCEYEPERFRFPKGSSPLDIIYYVPDFKITSGKRVWYIEVKGNMDREALEKARLFQKHFHWLKLYFALPDYYNSIREAYKNKIPHWE